MEPSHLGLLVFLAILFAFAAVGMLLRDIRAARLAAAPKGPVRLRRLVPQVEQGAGPISRFDRWFTRLVGETGLGWHPTAAALLLVFCALLPAAVLFLWREDPLPAMYGLFLGLPLPLGYLLYRRWKRVKLLQEQLAPSLEILARSVRAGQTLDQAIAHLGSNSPQPLAGEFRQAAMQLEMGLGLPAVMRALVDRVQLYDVRIFATTLTVHRQTGGNIAQVLERLAHVVRDRLAYRRQLRVATAAGRISAGLVSLIAPAIFLFFFFFRPNYIQTLLNSPLGQSMLILAVFLEVVGIIWTLRLLRPAY